MNDWQAALIEAVQAARKYRIKTVAELRAYLLEQGHAEQAVAQALEFWHVREVQLAANTV
jgi:hypothetical protein